MHIYLKGRRPHQSECGKFESGKLHWIQQEAIERSQTATIDVHRFFW